MKTITGIHFQFSVFSQGLAEKRLLNTCCSVELMCMQEMMVDTADVVIHYYSAENKEYLINYINMHC